MLVRFTVSNFLSFKEDTELNMLTGSPRRLGHHVYTPVKGLELLKMAALYGANGAGKSNVVKAMHYFRNLVVYGDWDTPARYKFRMDPGCQDRPSVFEIEFVLHNQTYIYGADILDHCIGEEWLYASGLGGDDKLIFRRTTQPDGKTRIEVAPEYAQGKEDEYRIKFYEENELKDRQLFLWKISEAKGGFDEIRLVSRWFKDKWVIVFPHSRPDSILKGLIHDAAFKVFAEELIAAFKTGIQSLSVDKMSFAEFFGADDQVQSDELYHALLRPEHITGIGFRNPQGREELYATLEAGQPMINKLMTIHLNGKGELFKFMLREESDGTQRLIDLIPALYQAVRDNAFVIIDEIEQSIHPKLLLELIRKFAQDEKTVGQLAFTTHEVHLLNQEFMRQDEFWFAEKNLNGETCFTPLSDYKDIRYDLDLRKGYLNGRFSAIPHISDLKKLNWTANAAQA